MVEEGAAHLHGKALSLSWHMESLPARNNSTAGNILFQKYTKTTAETMSLGSKAGCTFFGVFC